MVPLGRAIATARAPPSGDHTGPREASPERLGLPATVVAQAYVRSVEGNQRGAVLQPAGGS